MFQDQDNLEYSSQTTVLDNGQFLISWKNAQGEVEKGPLHFLWRLIAQHQVDVFHVSLFRITADFISFMKGHHFVDLDTLADFVSVLSRLLRAKSQALLPSRVGASRDDMIRLPQDIIERLLEYRRYQKHASFFRDREKLGAGVLAVHLRTSAAMQGKAVAVYDADDLLANFLRQYRKKKKTELPFHLQTQLDQCTVEQKMTAVLNVLKEKTKILPFVAFLTQSEKNDILPVITLFLALLELTRQQEISIKQESFVQPIYVSLRAAPLSSEPFASLNNR